MATGRLPPISDEQAEAVTVFFSEHAYRGKIKAISKESSTFLNEHSLTRLTADGIFV